MRINSPKCSFVKVAQRFYFTNFITKFTAISHAKYRNGLCTGLLGVYFLEPVARNQVQSDFFWNFLVPGLLAFRPVSFLQQTSLLQTVLDWEQPSPTTLNVE